MNVVEFLNVLSQKQVKLWADGEQLRLRAPKEVLTPTLLGQLKEHKGEILSWLKERDKDWAPLSQGQQAMWFLYQLAPQSVAYNLMYAARLSPELDVSALQEAAQALVARHPILRTTYTMHASREMPVQVVHEHGAGYFEVTDGSNWGQEEVEQWINGQADRPFDLEEGPVVRMNLLRRQGAQKEEILLLTVHHIAADFLSFQILINDLEALYQAFTSNATSPLPPLTLQYKDYVYWEANVLKAEEARLAAYWQEALAGAPQMLNLPTDRPRPPLQSYRGAQISFEIDEAMSKQIKELARANGVTPYMTLLAAFGVLLHRESGQKEILIGSPMESRQLTGTEKLIGYFVNPVVLRIDLTGNPEFKSLLSQVQKTVVAALKHQGYPFPLLVERLQANRDPSFSPIFQAGFAWEQPPWGGEGASFDRLKNLGSDEQSTEKKAVRRLITETLASGQRGSAFDLNFMIFDIGTSLRGSFQYSTDLFDECTIYRYVGHFQTLLEGIISNPSQPVAHLPLLTEAEREHLFIPKGHAVTEGADSPLDLSRGTREQGGIKGGRCIHQLFEQQVERTPDAVAVVFSASSLDGNAQEASLTYRELNVRANQLAHKLQSLGVGPNKLVGLCVENSLEMIVGLFGILKAGGAYVPISPTYPEERLRLMLETADLSVLLTQQHLREKLPTDTTQVLCLDSRSNDFRRKMANHQPH